MKTKSK